MIGWMLVIIGCVLGFASGMWGAAGMVFALSAIVFGRGLWLVFGKKFLTR